MAEEMLIVGIGEVLMDVFSDGTATIGGAPFNVAFQAHQLLKSTGTGRGLTVSAVGEDERGRSILDAMRVGGLASDFITITPDYPTGFATVWVKDGEAGYDIPPGQAWDHLEESDALGVLAERVSAVAFGCLAQRSPQSRQVIQRFLAAVTTHRLFDVNLRQNSGDGVKGYSVDVLESSCRLATIVKMNAAELDEVTGLLGCGSSSGKASGCDGMFEQMQALRQRFDLQIMVVTRGAEGALLCSAAEQVRLPDSTLRGPIHPVGAGDAFAAGLLYGLTQGAGLGVSARLADRLASWVTGYASATPPLTPELLAELQVLQQAV